METFSSTSIKLTREALMLSELHIATLNGDLQHVRELLKSTSTSPGGTRKVIEARDRHGTTPLMAAVLYGRLAIAKLLLRYGASRKAQDLQGRVTWEYSRASLFDRKPKMYQHLGFPPISRSLQRERRRIAIILKYPAALRSCRRIGNHHYSRSRLHKRAKDLVILKPVGGFETFKPGKEGNELLSATAGFIASATTSPKDVKVEQFAVSGWKPNPGRGPRVLDNVVLTERVRDVIHLHGLKVRASQRDNGNQTALPEHKGRFAACHVEKKLAVWWVMKALKEVFNTSDIERLRELRGADVPNYYREAMLFLDHGPCQDCWDFLHQVKRITGILICVESISFCVTGNRASGPQGCPNCTCQKCTSQKKAQMSRPSSDSAIQQDDEDSDESDKETRPSEDDMQLPLIQFETELKGTEDKGVRPPHSRSNGGIYNGTAAPDTWTVFPSTDLRPVAKPLNRIQKNIEASSRPICDAADPSNGAVLTFSLPHRPAFKSPVSSPGSEVSGRTQRVDPVSTMGGHSAYFEDDGHEPNIESPVAHTSPPQASRQPLLHPIYRSQISLNLERFTYAGAATSEAPGSLLSARLKKGRVGTIKDNDVDVVDGTNDNGSKPDVRTTRGKPKTSIGRRGKSNPRNRREVRRESSFRSRSTFARAVASRFD
ncbi:hypothetical protein QC761_711580 [Podospora bellae-mahoneyi]|uniref:Single-strand DNA deaminase toxin A-like C-terminal domain-containing protein n=1 Tax=Podospora bellae-mahoneyi TaxID=2093777 RepID=A0ABR0FAQ2_9PEZI|nr:hypothetical protein QC761_711580 [Podospora bellae-mahoneyi]